MILARSAYGFKAKDRPDPYRPARPRQPRPFAAGLFPETVAERELRQTLDFAHSLSVVWGRPVTADEADALFQHFIEMGREGVDRV